MPASRLSPLLLVLLLLGCSAGPNGDVRAQGRVHEVAAEGGMVVAGHPDAAAVGADVLARGGNAVDAAVATAFALAVVLPKAGNLGGGGFAVVRDPDGAVRTLDFRETAPALATATMFQDEAGEPVRERSTVGHLAAGVPGSPAGLLALHDSLGALPRAEVLDPAIRLAEEGFALTELQAGHLNAYRSAFLRFEGSRRYFTKPDSTRWRPAERLVQRDLGRTLRRIRDDGRDGFYRGPTADSLVAEMRRGGGRIRHEDLAAYEPVWRAPVTGTYRGYRVHAMGPPSSGGVALVTMLNAAEPAKLGALEPLGPASVHRRAEIMRRAFADRAAFAGDPAFVDVPVRRLTSKGYARSRMAGFDPRRATPSARIGPEPATLPESTETTHLSVVDGAGMAVSLTTTVNDWYGAKVAVPGAGFLLNDEMDDFTAAPGRPNLWGSVTGAANAVAPGKRMVSSMTPTIVEDPEGRLALVLGTPGGPTIINTVFNVILYVIDWEMTVQEAIAMPRFHHQWDPDQIRYERGGLPEETEDALRAMGHVLDPGGQMGAVSAVHVRYGDGGVRYEAGADPRRDVTARGS